MSRVSRVILNVCVCIVCRKRFDSSSSLTCFNLVANVVNPSSVMVNTGTSEVTSSICVENESDTQQVQSTYVRSARVTTSTSTSRCVVVSDSGQRYEIDRYCPHRGADLSKVRLREDSNWVGGTIS